MGWGFCAAWEWRDGKAWEGVGTAWAVGVGGDTGSSGCLSGSIPGASRIVFSMVARAMRVFDIVAVRYALQIRWSCRCEVDTGGGSDS